MNAISGTLTANRVDCSRRVIHACRLRWDAGVIAAIDDFGGEDPSLPYLLPGFVDAHVHIESSMLPPSEFARIAVRHGTVASVSDPHEIANVLGLDGVRLMLDDARQTPFHILFGAPSCVPATPFETAGAVLDPGAVATLLDEPGVGYLSEMMNFPGVLQRDPDVMAKIEAARGRGLPVDGHAPGLLAEQARTYAGAGISTDHECSSLQEARDKIAAGMWILIREGSAARNFAVLHPLISEHPDRVMLCSDDKHPDDLVAGHIDRLVAAAVALGHDLFDVLDCACVNPCRHYGLDLGLLQPGDAMDAVLVDDLTDFRPRRTWLGGRLVADEGRSLLPRVEVRPINRFDAREIGKEQLAIVAVGAEPDALCAAVNSLVARHGGIAVAADGDVDLLPLPLAGLMSLEDGDWTARRYARLDRRVRALGSPLRAPLMTLSFMALLVIPELKLSDRGLFDGRRFRFTELQVDAASLPAQ